MTNEWEGRSLAEWQALWQVGDVRCFDEIGSTNDVVAELARSGSPTLSLAIADMQTRGRGRGGASWEASRGSALLFSILFRVNQEGGAPTCAPIRVGLAVAEAIQELAAVETSVKWPNDVVINGCGKVAGVLCEGVFSGGSGQIVAGVGVNVTEFPPGLDGQACSLLSASGRTIARADLLTAILQRFHAFADRMTDPFDGLELKRLHSRDILRHQDVICDELRGTARGIATDGALLVEEGSVMHAIYNGTVRLAHSNAYPGGGKA